MKSIEPLTPISKKEKLRITVGNFLKIKLAAYGMSAVAGIAGGNMIQDAERLVTGYNPTKHEELLKNTGAKKANDFEDFKKEEKVKKKLEIRKWFSDMRNKMKDAAVDPAKYIEGTDIYRNLLVKYYEVLKFIDDTTFLVPALLIFIMLGGYLSRKL